MGLSAIRRRGDVQTAGAAGGMIKGWCALETEEERVSRRRKRRRRSVVESTPDGRGGRVC